MREVLRSFIVRIHDRRGELNRQGMDHPSQLSIEILPETKTALETWCGSVRLEMAWVSFERLLSKEIDLVACCRRLAFERARLPWKNGRMFVWRVEEFICSGFPHMRTLACPGRLTS